MPKKEDLTNANLLAAEIGSVVENISYDEALKEVGLTEKYVIKQLIAPQSSDVAKDYVKAILADKYESVSREDGSELYLIKKVACEASEYKAMAEAVNGEDTDKYKVLRVISCNAEAIGYKKDKPGIEAYLASGKTPVEALRKTTKEEPIFQYCSTEFDAEEAEEFDEAINKAFYEHTPEAAEALIELLMSSL